MDAGEILRATVFFTAPNASVAQIVLHWVLDGTSGDDDDITDLVDTWMRDVFIDQWTGIAAITAEAASRQADIVLPSGTVERNLQSYVLAIAGTSIAQVLPAANAAYFLAYTAFPKQRGSKYMPFVSEDSTIEGQFTPSAVADIGLLLAHYVTNLDVGMGNSLSPGVASRTLDQFVPFLNTGLLNDEPAYQRRRKSNVGS